MVLDGQLDSTFAYSFIVTDIPASEMTAVNVEHFHRHRAQIEERFKDLKLGQALRHLPSGKLAANCLWLLRALSTKPVRLGVRHQPAAGASGQADDNNAPLRRHAKTLRHLLFWRVG